jgi:hypothetical protein
VIVAAEVALVGWTGPNQTRKPLVPYCRLDVLERLLVQLGSAALLRWRRDPLLPRRLLPPDHLTKMDNPVAQRGMQLPTAAVQTSDRRAVLAYLPEWALLSLL